MLGVCLARCLQSTARLPPAPKAYSATVEWVKGEITINNPFSLFPCQRPRAAGTRFIRYKLQALVYDILPWKVPESGARSVHPIEILSDRLSQQKRFHFLELAFS